MVAFLTERRRKPRYDESVHVFPLGRDDLDALVEHLFPPDVRDEFAGYRSNRSRQASGHDEDLSAFIVRGRVRFRYSPVSRRLEVTMTQTHLHRHATPAVAAVFRDCSAAVALANEDGALDAAQVALTSTIDIISERKIKVRVHDRSGTYVPPAGEAGDGAVSRPRTRALAKGAGEPAAAASRDGDDDTAAAPRVPMIFDTVLQAEGAKLPGAVFETDFSHARDPADLEGKSHPPRRRERA